MQRNRVIVLACGAFFESGREGEVSRVERVERVEEASRDHRSGSTGGCNYEIMELWKWYYEIMEMEWRLPIIIS